MLVLVGIPQLSVGLGILLNQTLFLSNVLTFWVSLGLLILCSIISGIIVSKVKSLKVDYPCITSGI